MKQVVVIGNGPAGVSAAVYAVRAGAKATIVGKENSALKKAHKIDNYYGFYGISGDELFQKGIEQAESLGITLIDDEVVGVGFNEKLTIITTKGEIEADAIIIATGVSRTEAPILGVSQFEGKGISYCAVCDGFFFKNKKVGVLGSGKYAIHEAKELLSVTDDITIFTDEKELEEDVPSGIKVNTLKVQEVIGENKLEKIVVGGNTLDIDALFIAKGIAGSLDLARKIGIITEGNKIMVNENMETNVLGVYGAGDCTGGLLQIAKAVYEGAKAGTEAVKYINGLK